ncbi:MAG: patatin-like phospholipase family protein [Provencibacterium sp.]|jgi:NTE family protein|nr:patatin-like phospholipase family protein [Provencibacterium sp.]
MGSKRALALAGGGSRGAYQIGVWQALREYGVDYQIVTGTSVGALNGAMFVQGDYDEARQLWLRLTSQDVANVDLSQAAEAPDPARAVYAEFLRQAVAGGGVDIGGLETIMRAVVDEKRFRASPVDFGLVTVEYPSLRPVTMCKADIPPGKLCDYLIASASCFPAFPTKLIDDVQFIDGGYHDNLPINLAVELGAEEVIAVDLESVGIRQRPKNVSVPITWIRPQHSLGPFLLFEPDSAGRNMTLGYLDALRALGRAEGAYLTFRPGETGKLMDSLRPALEEAVSWLEDPEGGLLSLLPQRRREDWPERCRQAVQQLGQWYELEETLLYTAHSFSYELLLRFNAQEAEPSSEIAEVFSRAGTALQLAGQLSVFGRRQLCGFIFTRLRESALGYGNRRELQHIAAVLQNETAAALLIFALKRTLAEEE